MTGNYRSLADQTGTFSAEQVFVTNSPVPVLWIDQRKIYSEG
jgi:hypothetical protein